MRFIGVNNYKECAPTGRSTMNYEKQVYEYFTVRGTLRRHLSSTD